MREQKNRRLHVSQRTVAATLDDQARPTLRGSLLVVTLFLATVPLFPSNNRIFSHFVADDDMVTAFMTALFLACIMAGVALLLYGSWKPTWNGWRRATLVIGVVGYITSQVLLWAALIAGTINVPFAIAIGATSGLFAPFAIYAWVRCYDVNFRDILFHGSIVCAASTALTWLISLFPLIPAALAMALCAIVGCAFPLYLMGKNRSLRMQEPTHTASSDPELPAPGAPLRAAAASLLSVTWLPLLGFLLANFMMSGLTMSVGIVNTELIGAFIASVIGLAVCLIARQSSLAVLVNRLVLPVSMAVSLILGSSPDNSPLFDFGMATVYGPLFFLSLYGFSALIAVINSGEFPLSLAFGALLPIASLVLLGGFRFGMAVAGNDTLAGQTQWAFIASYIAIVLVYLGYSSYRQLAHLGSSDPVSEGETDRPSDSGNLAALKSAQIEKMAEDANLSKRELEVFDFIARGYNSTYIANSLFISPNTARTHIRNIYRKLGVTSREELLESLNREE